MPSFTTVITCSVKFAWIGILGALAGLQISKTLLQADSLCARFHRS